MTATLSVPLFGPLLSCSFTVRFTVPFQKWWKASIAGAPCMLDAAASVVESLGRTRRA